MKHLIPSLEIALLAGFLTADVSVTGRRAWAASAAPQALPDFDRRLEHDQSTVPKTTPKTVSPATRVRAEEVLRERLPTVQVDRHPIHGSPKWVASRQGFLTGPNGQGRAMAGAAAPKRALPADDPDRVVKAFVDEHAALFGHDASALERSPLVRDAVTPHSGLRTVAWRQRHQDIEIVDAVFQAHLTRDGELVNVSSQFITDPAAAGPAGPGQRPNAAAPVLSAEDALRFALEHLGEDDLQAELVPIDVPAGAERRLRFQSRAIKRQAHTRLVWLPMHEAQLRLCWSIAVKPRSRAEVYRLILDATTGEVLVRRCQTIDLSNASYRVFTSDSPTPFSPGYSEPGNSGQPASASRTLVTLSALNTTASPNGWINDGVNETRGNNIDASTDLDGDDALDLPRPAGSPNRVFDFTLNLTQAPSTYWKASVVSLFYWMNWTHDKLWELGFTEAAGNFQDNNFGRGGVGNDALDAEAQDGEGIENANFNYWDASDGEPAWIQMYLWPDGSPDRDGDLDTEIMVHEYVHGLSLRLVGAGVGLTDLQSRAMGEGWSDFYALALLSSSGDAPAGCYPVGGYALRDWVIVGRRFAEGGDNYYFGIRRYPYSTDMSKSPLTFKDISSAQDSSHPGVPVSPIFSGTSAEEVHNMGEIWCVALWEARAALIQRHGFNTGNTLILRLVTDGMKLAPANPNMLQARDAILQADQVLSGGANRFDLWTAFAKRGMGADASSPDASTTSGLVENFDFPDDMKITAPADLQVTGPEGGPFIAAPKIFTLRNSGGSSFTWSVLVAPPIEAGTQTGVLAAGASRTVGVSLDANAAATFPQGTYRLPIVFSNHQSHFALAYEFQLTVSPDEPPCAELFEDDFDLDNTRITFTPAESNAYHVCRSAATNFPTPTDAAMTLTVPENGRVVRSLAEGKHVTLFGLSYTSVNVHENGYLTFTTQPSQDDVEDATRHFDTPRVSALMTPLSTNAGSRISWQQLSDRCVASWEWVRDEDTVRSNKFQVELFFDGVIRLTFLNVQNTTGATGLSAGGGTPPGFIEADFSEVIDCATPEITLTLPASVTEGVRPKPGAGQVSIPRTRIGDLTVHLTSSDSTEIQVPNSVRILARQTSASFDLEPIDDALRDGTQLAYVAASAPGFATGFARIRVHDDENVTLSVSLPPDADEGNTNVLGRVSMNATASGVVSVALQSSSPADLTVPPVVLIPGGQTSAVFRASVPEDRKIESLRFAAVGAIVANWTSGYDTILIYDNEKTNVVLRAPEVIVEGAGLVSNLCRVSIGGTLETNLTVSLLTSNALDILPLGPVIIPAGQTNAGVVLAIGDNADLDGVRVVRLAATAPAFLPGTAVVIVGDNDLPPEPANPYPPDGATNWMLNTHLSWDPAEGELLINGNFETGDLTGWTLGGYGGGGFVLNDGTFDPDSPDAARPPLAGSFSALAVQFGNGEHTLAQDFYIPDGATSAALTWRHQIRNHAGVFAANQRFAAELRRADDNALLTTLYSTQVGDPAFSDPTNLTATLMPWRGERVRLVFVETDGLGHLNVHLDSISVLAGSASPITYDVYLGNDTTPDEGEYLGSTTQASWQPLPLAGGRDYYWQVVARRGSSTNAGPVWQFSTSGASQSTTLFSYTSGWRYMANGQNLGTTWRTTGYDDRHWSLGRAPLGFGSTETTTIGHPTNDYITFYFRSGLTLDDTNRLATVTAMLKRDDGAVVYINGVEAFRDNMPSSGRLDYLTQASSIVSGAEETNAVSHAMNPSLFVQGTNLIAVELHQRRNGAPFPGPSPDLFFDLALTARTNTGNMAPKAITWTTPSDFDVAHAPTNLLLRASASDESPLSVRVKFFADGALLGEDTLTPFSQIWNNAPLGLHTFLAVATDSGGLSVTSAPLHVLVAPGEPGQSLITLVAPGDIWRYRDNGFDPGLGWTATGYRESRDGSWKGGPSQLGYGDGDEATELDVRTDLVKKPITAYFRRQFNNDLAVSAAVLRVLRDDGIAVYLNGREVFRDNLPAGTIRSNTLALASLTGVQENTWLSTDLSPSLLQEGANLVAAEVHQVTSGSVDLSFDLELAAAGNVLPSVALTTPAPNSQLVAPPSLLLAATASDPYGAVTQVQFLRNGSPLATDTVPPYEFTWNNPPAGVHTLTAVATDNLGATKTSGAVQVTVLLPVELAIASTNGQTVLWWPDTSPGYRLQSATNLASPIFWLLVPNPVVQTNGQFRVTVEAIESQRFFRLDTTY
ncbi:MAG: M36 family metallopeptidase [Verrucomicrobia bacterium]|nr:M36 family metallopeptidase [Verrucomicrobiota bacterium]